MRINYLGKKKLDKGFGRIINLDRTAVISFDEIKEEEKASIIADLLESEGYHVDRFSDCITIPVEDREEYETLVYYYKRFKKIAK